MDEGFREVIRTATEPSQVSELYSNSSILAG